MYDEKLLSCKDPKEHKEYKPLCPFEPSWQKIASYILKRNAVSLCVRRGSMYRCFSFQEYLLLQKLINVDMLLPIGDDNSDRQLTPVVNYLLIALNVFVFVYFQHFGHDIQFTFGYATVPAEIISGHDIVTNSQIIQDSYTGQSMEMPGLQPTPVPVYLTLFTSMFMHGGIAHIAGNMLYLWIFGDNLENIMGHRNYLFFYLLCGIIAGLSHVFSTVYFSQSMLTPSLGASGAIAGVLGGYMLLFPSRGVHVWILWFIVSLPAFIVVGLWFVFQIVSGTGAVGGEEAGQIAYAAHIGGFIAGFALVKFFIRRPQVLPPNRRKVLF